MKRINSFLTDGVVKSLHVYDEILLSGSIITARDAAHKRLYDRVALNEELPINIKNKIIYYVGPSPARPGHIVGACGPTSSYRMDKYTPGLLNMGLKGMIGKGDRTDLVINSMVANNCVYFAAIGGTAALISKCVTNEKIICYEDLQTEAIREYIVKDMPLVVAIDSFGNNIYRG